MLAHSLNIHVNGRSMPQCSGEDDFDDGPCLEGIIMRDVAVLLSVCCVVAFINPVALICTIPAYALAKKVRKLFKQN